MGLLYTNKPLCYEIDYIQQIQPRSKRVETLYMFAQEIVDFYFDAFLRFLWASPSPPQYNVGVWKLLKNWKCQMKSNNIVYGGWGF